MSNQQRLSSVLLKTGVTVGIDQFAFNKRFNVNQAAMDAGNYALTEYMTRNVVMGFTENMFQGMADDQKKLVIDTLLGVSQDFMMGQFLGSRKRTPMESVVAFGSSEFVGSQVSSRFPDMFA